MRYVRLEFLKCLWLVSISHLFQIHLWIPFQCTLINILYILNLFICINRWKLFKILILIIFDSSSELNHLIDLNLIELYLYKITIGILTKLMSSINNDLSVNDRCRMTTNMIQFTTLQFDFHPIQIIQIQNIQIIINRFSNIIVMIIPSSIDHYDIEIINQIHWMLVSGLWTVALCF